MITRPMLAANCDALDKITFPCIATPKIDGIRCLKVGGKALSRTFKPIPNVYVRNYIEAHCPDGFDGELLVGETFQDCTSGIMSRDGEPDFTYWVFDYVTESLDKPYVERLIDLNCWFYDHASVDHVDKVESHYVVSPEHLEALITQAELQGLEGLCVRAPQSPYKCGRATFKQGWLTKIKFWQDAEAQITGFEEAEQNLNTKTQDAFGNTKRSTHQENKVGKGTTGVILAKDLMTGLDIRIGTGKGLTAELKQAMWNQPADYVGKVFRYQFQPGGSKDSPRIPSFQGFRNQEDM
jgi:DNA ligase-1